MYFRSEDSHPHPVHACSCGTAVGEGNFFLEFRLDSNQMRRSTQKHRTKALGLGGGPLEEGPSAQPTNRRLILPPARLYY